MTYQELKNKHQESINNFEGIFFAFSEEAYRKGVEKVGASVTNKITRIGAGGFILSSRIDDFDNLMKKNKEELKQFRKDQENLIDSLAYELSNHEYCITMDETDALEALDLDANELPNEVLKKAIKKAYPKGLAYYC